MPTLQNIVAQLQAFLASREGVAAVVALAFAALLLLVLWLRARTAPGEAELRKELKAAQNQAKLLKGDAIQASRDHAAAIATLSKELETLRAVAGGTMPPELERALAAEARLQSEMAAMAEQHRKQIQILEAALGASSTTGTIIAPSSQAVRERMERLERELAEARQQLAAAADRHQAELTALAERLGAEKAAALTAQAGQHASELDMLRRSGTFAAVGAPARPTIDLAGLAADAEPPDSVRFPFLETVAGGTVGARFYLPYGTTSIGRGESNTIVLADNLASRHHADIVFDGVDFRIEDDNSTNGTFLDDKPVAGAVLNFGDVLGIGELKLRFGCAASDAAASDPAFAVAAYGAMVRIAPGFRLALAELAKHGPAQIKEIGEP